MKGNLWWKQVKMIELFKWNMSELREEEEEEGDRDVV